jgi:hypothetical protein
MSDKYRTFHPGGKFHLTITFQEIPLPDAYPVAKLIGPIEGEETGDTLKTTSFRQTGKRTYVMTGEIPPDVQPGTYTVDTVDMHFEQVVGFEHLQPERLSMEDIEVGINVEPGPVLRQGNRAM